MREMQIMAGVVSLVVACVLAVELYWPQSGGEAAFIGLLCVCFLAVGFLALVDAYFWDEEVWVEDLTLDVLKDVQGKKR